jgi:hypothetical protein
MAKKKTQSDDDEDLPFAPDLHRDRLLARIEDEFNRLEQTQELLLDLLKMSTVGNAQRWIELRLKTSEQTRRTIETANRIINPKQPTVFIKNAIAQQVNQLVTETQEIKRQLGSATNAQMDTSHQREAAAINTSATTLET